MKANFILLVLLIIIFHAASAMQDACDTFESRMQERKTNITKTKERIEKTKERIRLLILKKQEYKLKKTRDEFFSVEAREDTKKNTYEIIFSRGSLKNGFRKKTLYTNKTGLTYAQFNKSFLLTSHPEVFYLYNFINDTLSWQPKERGSWVYLLNDMNDIIEIQRLGWSPNSFDEQPRAPQECWSDEDILSLFD